MDKTAKNLHETDVCSSVQIPVKEEEETNNNKILYSYQSQSNCMEVNKTVYRILPGSWAMEDILAGGVLSPKAVELFEKLFMAWIYSLGLWGL